MKQIFVKLNSYKKTAINLANRLVAIFLKISRLKSVIPDVVIFLV